MSTPRSPILTLCLATESDTAAFGTWLAGHLVAGDTVLLSGPIGAGKSHLARALIRSRLGDPDAEVPSPTFTLVQTYEAPDGVIWHADLYRIGHPDEVGELGLDAAFDTAIVVVEWPEKLGHWQPADAILINLAPQDDGRIARIDAGPRPGMIAALHADWPVQDG